MRRKNQCAFLAHIFTCLYLFCPFSILIAQSQITNPAKWSTTVMNVEQNPLLIDTFLIQSFEGKLTDTWSYTTNTGVVFDASADGITGQGGDRSLKLLSNTNVLFEDFVITPYRNVKIKMLLAAKSLTKNESFTVEADRIDGLFKRVWAIAQTNNYNVQYRQDVFGEDGKRTNPIQIDTNPHNVRLQTSELQDGGYFCIDSVFAQGEISSYSLFTGKGLWHDEARWSHLPPVRRRSALVNGEVAFEDDAQCNQILLSDGSIQLNEEVELTVNNITFFGFNTSFVSEGDVKITDKVSVERTFAEVGVWYFISFPFDVYQSGIDAAFQLKDATPNAGGNYIYVQSYNGERRSLENKAYGNWEVISPSTLGGQPVFRKNRGYLIALDEKATKKSVTFSSASGVVTSNFGKIEGQIPVLSSSASDQAHAGWYLCGNPLPAPLSLKLIASNSELDGNIYVYDGSAYKSYAIGSNYTLPPYAAFFVKAKSNTQLQIKPIVSPLKGTMLSLDSPLRSGVVEPLIATTPTSVKNEAVEAKTYVKGNILYSENLPQLSKLSVYDLSGRSVYNKQLLQGNTSTVLPLKSGCYLIKIESSVFTTQFKSFVF